MTCSDEFDEIAEQRQELLAAFRAQYKLDPDEVEQVHRMTADGMEWFVRRRSERPARCAWRRAGRSDCGLARPASPVVPSTCPRCGREIEVVQ